MQQDAHGYRLTTNNTDAATAMSSATESYVGWRTDTMDHIKAATTADPDFALPYAVKGILMAGLRKPELRAPAQKQLDAARNARAPETEREQRYISALAAAIDGRLTEAVTHYEAIAREHPHDLLALRLAQFELFWIGEVHWMRDISERAAPAWSKSDPGLGAFLAIRAFGLEETRAYAEAERCGRQAIDVDPNDPWAAHAVAHVLIMQGRLKDGIEWCSGLSSNWGAANHIRHHNWWHLALFHTEARNYDQALAIYDDTLRDLNSPLMQAVPDFYVDIQNDIALLQRLELRGVDVGDRWSDISDLAADRIGNHESPFTSAHCALGLAAANRIAEAEELVRAMYGFVAETKGTLGPRYALAAIPAAEASIAHRKGDHQGVLDILLPARRNLWQMGGSHAQRDLFMQLLADSAVRLGRKDVLAVFFEELNSIGLEHLEERSSYADALAAMH
ncbi:MAG: tetratricopeptide repeat protein [Pseudomonadota bacterium]